MANGWLSTTWNTGQYKAAATFLFQRLSLCLSLI